MIDRTEVDWWGLCEDLLEPGQKPLSPLQVTYSSLGRRSAKRDELDYLIELALPAFSGRIFRFAVELSTRSTLKELQRKEERLRLYLRPGTFPLVVMPYLSSSLLDYVEDHQISALDLCGNGLVQIPGSLFVKRSGQPNLYPNTQPLQNPYKGRSAMVARAFFETPELGSVTALHQLITAEGVPLGLPQVSKALARLQDDLVVEKTPLGIRLSDPLRLLDKLGEAWKEPSLLRRFVTIPFPDKFALPLNDLPDFKWSVAGSSSVSRYATFAQGGPPRLMVSNLSQAQNALGADTEKVANFADLELCETSEPGYYFGAKRDEHGVNWANPVQTWLELQGGDARQQETARDVRRGILASFQQ